MTPKVLQEILGRAVKGTFEMLTVDGDMSTNDTLVALANGLAGNARIAESGPGPGDPGDRASPTSSGR